MLGKWEDLRWWKRNKLVFLRVELREYKPDNWKIRKDWNLFLKEVVLFFDNATAGLDSLNFAEFYAIKYTFRWRQLCEARVKVKGVRDT